MKQNIKKLTEQGTAKPKVFNVRNRHVVLDKDVAAYVGMSTGNLNLYVKRNIKLFDDEMWFKLSEEECSRLQIVILNTKRGGNVKYLPFAFTKEGISMLEKVLKRSIKIEFEEEVIEAEVLPESWNEGTVVLYQPNEDIKIDVRVENETVWLTQEQMCVLFGVNRNTISHHISNIFKEKELEKISVYQYFRHTASDGKTYTVTIYNLDVIISVGYRVKSLQGTWFRQWANKIIKNHLLYKESLERRVISLEEQTKSIVINTENRLSAIEQKVEFIVDTKLPPIEMVFYEGENFKAYDFLCSLIESAQKRIILIDNYIDRKTLLMLNKRVKGVSATVYTNPKNLSDPQIQLDLTEANRKREAPLIKVLEIKHDHDRFLIIDNTSYLLGPSIKDAGVNRCAVVKMHSSPEIILKHLIP